MKLILPPELKFDDIYMDAPQVEQELNIDKRVLRNLRVSGKISYTGNFSESIPLFQCKGYQCF